MYDLERFTLKDMTECGAALRKLGDGCHAMEEVAQRTVEHLYMNLGAGGKPSKAAVLVRFYITHRYGGLSGEIQGSVHSDSDVTLISESPCLALLATMGSKSEWCKRELAKPYQATVLPNPLVSEQFPVVAQMVGRFDLPGAALVSYNANLFADRTGQNYDVLFISDAKDEPAVIPDQAGFVLPHAVKSVIGFGGLLPSGNLFSVVVFSKIALTKQSALAFRPFALNTKIALLPFDDDCPIFSSQVTMNGRS